MLNHEIGYIDTPSQGNKRPENVDWCADNGCFSERWNETKWWQWLDKQPRTMRFATVPDVVADWNATLERFEQYAPQMTTAGFPIAVVAQDGAQISSVPWQRISAVFIGGSTEWKLSKTSEAIIQEANRLSIWCHVGRVNTFRRLRWARDAGANSVDGTMLTFQPTENFAKLRKWLRVLEDSQPLPIGN